MDLFERVSEDIKTAMKAKDKVALETLRNIKKVFLEAKTAPGANDTLTDDAALKIMQKLMKQGNGGCFQETCRTCRRTCHFCQSKRIAGIISCFVPSLPVFSGDRRRRINFYLPKTRLLFAFY